jgi:hypothetical protein
MSDELLEDLIRYVLTDHKIEITDSLVKDFVYCFARYFRDFEMCNISRVRDLENEVLKMIEVRTA